MKKKKMFILLGLIIIVAIITLGAIYFVKKSKYDFAIKHVTQIDYNIISREERYGVINRNGDVIIEPIYDIIQIPDPSKDIFICMYEYNVEKKEYQIEVLNSKKEQLYQEYENVQAIPTETTYDNIPFEKTALKYKKDGKYGLLSIDGKKLTEPIYDEISAILYKEGMLLVKKEEKSGVINIKGKELIPIEYETITADNYYSDETLYKTTGFIVSKKSDKGYRYGYINYKGDVILKTEYTEVERVTDWQDDKNVYLVALKDGQAGLLKNRKVLLNYEYEDISYNAYNQVFVIQRNGKQGISDTNGKIKIGTEYENILFGGIYINAQKDNQLFLLDLNGNEVADQGILSKFPTKDGKHFIICDRKEVYKIVDENGNVVLDNHYSYMEEIKENFYVVGNNAKNGIVDLTGKSFVELKYNSIFSIDGTELVQANISNTDTISLIDKNMNVLATMDHANIEVKRGYVHIYSETDSKYFDYTGKPISSQEALPNNSLFAKLINEKWGFVDVNGNLKIQNEYDMVTEFNEYGFAGIKKDGKWGSINKEGKVVQEPIYELKWIHPNFIGKFYQSTEWNSDLYYIDKVEEGVKNE